jgi:hypothetical protein
MELKCLSCIVEHKMWNQTVTSARGVEPEMRTAVTLAAIEGLGPVTPICYQHLQINRPTGLMIANGQLPSPGR